MASRNRGPVRNIEDYCGICGMYITGIDKDICAITKHKCPKKTLAAIDAANTRAINQELLPQSSFNDPQIDERLKDGFRMIDGDPNIS